MKSVIRSDLEKSAIGKQFILEVELREKKKVQTSENLIRAVYRKWKGD